MPTPSRTRATVQLFVNPRPGRRARRRIDALRRALEKAGARVLVTASEAGPLAVDPRADRICAVGGDGTLRHVVEALHRSGRAIPIGVYPLGTVNLLARECGYPRSPRAFAARLLGDARRPPPLHTALVGAVPMTSCASVGPESLAVSLVSPALKRRIGRAAYLVALCRLLPRWRPVAMTLAWDGGWLDCEAVYVAKGRFFAGPWSFAPAARAADPWLHVVALRTASRRAMLRFAWTLLRRGRVDALDGVRCFRCTALTIAGAWPAPVQVDGDIEARLPVRISLRPDPTVFA